MVIFHALVLLYTTSVAAQVNGPFGIPEQFERFQFPQLATADCTLPLPLAKRSSPTKRVYSAGNMNIQITNRVRVQGKDVHGFPWEVQMDIRQGGCWLFQGDLDRNGHVDLIMLTSDATSAGDSIATLLMIDRVGRPVPWQTVGHFTVNDNGLANLVDLEGKGRAQLLYLYVEGYDRGSAYATSLARYEIKDAHLRRVDGQFAGVTFPIISPKRAKIRGEPNLSNTIEPETATTYIASLELGKHENCGLQMPITRQSGEAVSVDAGESEALIKSCYDTLLLSDGSHFALPAMVVLDRHISRQIALAEFGPRNKLLIEAQKSHLAVQLAGRVCDRACGPFLLWATERSR